MAGLSIKFLYYVNKKYKDTAPITVMDYVFMGFIQVGLILPTFLLLMFIFLMAFPPEINFVIMIYMPLIIAGAILSGTYLTERSAPESRASNFGNK
jgi:Na+-transporting NADH:ubiquinone oxidoreductase subunit NqrE